MKQTLDSKLDKVTFPNVSAVQLPFQDNGGKCLKLFKKKSEINWENKKVYPDIIQLFPGPNWLAAFVLKF